MISPAADSPLAIFITEICTHINPLDVARWMAKENNLSRGTYAAYIGGAIQMHFHKRRARCELLGINARQFTALCMARIEHVLTEAEHYDTIGELQEFAQFLKRPKKFFSMPKGE